jgi:hypothetical protein
VAQIADLIKTDAAFLHLELSESGLIGLGAATTNQRLSWNGQDAAELKTLMQPEALEFGIARHWSADSQSME